MKKKTVLILLATLTATIFLFNGCGKKEIVSETVEEIEDTVSVAEPEIVEDIVEEELAEVEETDNTISDNWEDLEFLLEGVKFKLPCDIKEFEKAGWTFQPYGAVERDIFPHGYYGSDASLHHESKRGRIGINPCNNTDEIIDVKDCMTDIVDFDRFYRDNIIDVVVAKGITFGSTKQEVLEAYGEPDKTSVSKGANTHVTHMTYVSDNGDVEMELNLDSNDYVYNIFLRWDVFRQETMEMISNSKQE